MSILSRIFQFKPVFFLLAFFAASFSLLSPGFAATEIPACTTISNPNTYYFLSKNINSGGTCINIRASNIIIDGKGYTINYSNSASGYGVNNSGGYDNVTIVNANIIQGNPGIAGSNAIFASGMTGSNISNNNMSSSEDSVYLLNTNSNTISNNNIVTSGGNSEGIRSSSSNSNTISGNVIATSGFNGYGIHLSSSGTNILSNNAITTSGSSSYGIYLESSSNSNTVSDNIITTSGSNAYGINIVLSSNNNIAGGSIASRISYDYYLGSAGTTNNFTNTNFTAKRQIGFADSASWFNYNNKTTGSLWLKTSISSSGSISRTLANWTQPAMAWNDTAPGRSATYSLTGLIPGATYYIYNTSAGVLTNPYIMTASGGSISFAIRINGNTEIRVQDTPISGADLDCGDLNIPDKYYTMTKSVSSAGTCFTIKANNITLDGNGFTVNYSKSLDGYGVNNSLGYDNITIKNVNFIQQNSSVLRAHAIYFVGATYGNIANNTISVSGGSPTGAGSGDGIMFKLSGSNSISNNKITVKGGNSDGIWLDNSNSNSLYGNDIMASGSLPLTSLAGINIFQSPDNNIVGGSVISLNTYDYILNIAGANNSFRNTNFTASRKIFFRDSASWFNYNNETTGNIWLKTRIALASNYTNRTLITWSQSKMNWNDTGSIAGLMAFYNITGLSPGTKYYIYNTSSGIKTNPYNIITDFAGALSFNISLNGNTEILVTSTVGDLTPPAIVFEPPTPVNGTTTANNWTYINTSVSDNLSPNNITAFIDFNRSLVGWWRFNNEPGENSTLFRDWSGNGNNATCAASTCPTSVSGKLGSALLFRKTIDKDFASTIKNIASGPAGTMEARINPDGNYSSYQTIMGGGDSGGSDRFARYMIQVLSSDCPLGDWTVILGNDTNSQSICSGQTFNSVNFPRGVWKHLAVTYNGSMVSVYNDGALVRIAAQTVSGMGSAQPFSIGRPGAYNGAYFNGSIDEVKIWNRALSQEEIRASYNAGIYGLHRNFTNLADGTYTYTAYAQDLAGNVGQTETRTLYIARIITPIQEVVIRFLRQGSAWTITRYTIYDGHLARVTLTYW